MSDSDYVPPRSGPSNGYELRQIPPHTNPHAYAIPETSELKESSLAAITAASAKTKKKVEEEEPDLYDDEEDDRDHTPQASKWPSVLADGWKAYLLRTLTDVFLGSRMNVLLLCIPIAIICDAAHAPDWLIFLVSLAALCPLAERIAFVTDEMAKYTTDTIGGLMSATMGNITELIVSLVALSQNKLIIVQLSLVGSIVSNLLLVLGCSFLVGGIKYKTQRYSKPAAIANAGLLLLSVSALLFPMTMAVTHTQTDIEKKVIPNVADPNVKLNLALSQFCGFVLFLTYFLLIIYQLKTHASLFDNQDDDEEEEPPVLGVWGAVFWAAVITGFIALLSEYIVQTIEGAAHDAGIPIMFIATILLPIVGNAAEHASAIIFAWRNKMDIALGIAVGSATQIALFVVPLCVIVGLMMGLPFTLDFGVFPTISLYLTIIMTMTAIQSGTSDWLKGAILLVAYVLLSATFWVIDTPFELKPVEIN